MTTSQRIAVLVAMDANGLIGRDNGLPWRLPDDMAWFREHSMGKPCIMGRKTYESIPPRFRPLPGRMNIVVTRRLDYEAPGTVVVHTIEDALAAAGDASEIVIIGGAEIYHALMPRVNRLYLTQVHGTAEGDVYFPVFNPAEWREVYRREHPADETHMYSFTWLILDRSPQE